MSSASVSEVAGEQASIPMPRRPLLVAPLMVAVVALAFATLPLDHAIVAATSGVALVLVSAIDLERHIIPNRIVLPAAAIVLAEQLLLFTDRFPECLIAGLAAAAVFIAPALLGRAWMGVGDAKLVLLIGFALGWGVVGAVLIAFLCILPVALVLLIKGGIAARKAMIPFGPVLALGALAVLFLPHLLGASSS